MEHITYNKKTGKKEEQKKCSMFYVPCSIKQRGFVASLTTLLVLVFMLSVAISMSVLIFGRQKISTNTINSTQSYYTAEAGAEDALIRLKSNPQMSSLSYSLNINNSTANVVIPIIIGGLRAITSQGNNNGLIKTIQVVYSVDSDNVSFYYGVQVGNGGLQMSNGSKIHGNVFSSGNITGGNSVSSTSNAIDNNVVISGNGNSIQGVYVGGNVISYSCLTTANVGSLTYVIGGSHTCTVRGTTSVQSSSISSQPLPIPQSQIDSWKTKAAVSVITGNVIVNQDMTMGPKKITGSLTVDANLIISGTIYVVGNIIINSGANVALSSSYGSLGGVIVSDGTITINNNSILSGSGQTGSYLLFLSTNTSDVAILVSNNASGAVFYTNAGGVTLSNNVSVVEATGYKVIMSNNSSIQYSSGVVNIFFSGGPGGGWKVTSWQEK